MKHDRYRRRTNRLGAASPIWIVVFFGVVLFALGVTVLAGIQPEALKALDFNLGETVASIGVVMIATPMLYAIFGKPLQEAIETRTKILEATFAEAEELKATMQTMKSDYEQRLQAAEASAREQIQAQLKEVQSLRATLMAEASEKSDAMVKSAREEIEREKHKVVTELRSHVVDLTMAAGAKLIGHNLDSKANRSLVEDFVAHAEAPN